MAWWRLVLDDESFYRYVIFNWVIHEKNILDIILSQISDLKFDLAWFSLICSSNTLEERLKKRKDSAEKIQDSIHRLEKYKNMDSIKINTDHDIEDNIQLMKQFLVDLK